MSKVEGQTTHQRRRRGRPRDVNARYRLLQAAGGLLAEVGYREVTIEAIARRARASKATIYRWWPNKPSILIEAVREAVWEEWPHPSTGLLGDDVRTFTRRLVEVLAGSKGHILAAFVAGAQHDPEISAALRQIWFGPRASEIREMLRRHTSRWTENIDINVLVDLLHAPLYYRALTGCGPLSCDYSDAIAEAVLTVLQPAK
jgi:AcrR family transcriptional regulator